MRIVLNGAETLEVEDRPTRFGHRVINSSQGTINTTEGYAAFVESPQVGAHPWVAYSKLGSNGQPDFESTTSRMPLNKSTITQVML